MGVHNIGSTGKPILQVVSGASRGDSEIDGQIPSRVLTSFKRGAIGPQPPTAVRVYRSGANWRQALTWVFAYRPTLEVGVGEQVKGYMVVLSLPSMIWSGIPPVLEAMAEAPWKL